MPDVVTEAERRAIEQYLKRNRPTIIPKGIGTPDLKLRSVWAKGKPKRPRVDRTAKE